MLVQGSPVYRAFPYQSFCPALTTPCWGGGGVSGASQDRRGKGLAESHSQEIAEVFYCLGWAKFTWLRAGQRTPSWPVPALGGEGLATAPIALLGTGWLLV